MDRGTCPCGAVEEPFDATVKPPAARQCSQCRKTPGPVRASAPAARTGLCVNVPVARFQSPRQARRGFCPRCGSSRLWDHEDGAHVAAATGCPGRPSGMRLGGHIFTADKGGCLGIAGGLPRS